MRSGAFWAVIGFPADQGMEAWCHAAGELCHTTEPPCVGG